VLRGTHHLINLQRGPRALPGFGGSRQGVREADLQAVREALAARGGWPRPALGLTREGRKGGAAAQR
jgi:hypothetical protein